MDTRIEENIADTSVNLAKIALLNKSCESHFTQLTESLQDLVESSDNHFTQLDGIVNKIQVYFIYSLLLHTLNYVDNVENAHTNLHNMHCTVTR